MPYGGPANPKDTSFIFAYDALTREVDKWGRKASIAAQKAQTATMSGDVNGARAAQEEADYCQSRSEAFQERLTARTSCCTIS
mmetsp:Transcript_34260/g.47826  ORF Transcript_34260/g.47826 Transcript_34260/m.47826 type:complete len:83 (+) Transcript_34260:168-416(+)